MLFLTLLWISSSRTLAPFLALLLGTVLSIEALLLAGLILYPCATSRLLNRFVPFLTAQAV